MLNCTAGTIDDSNFSKPMPVIGLYIAAATLLCAVLMAIDAGKGLLRKQYWIPTKYFPVDAASLTFVGVAIKLSVDLSSAMPSKVDQLAKLSTSAFICTVLANILPSLGRLANGELLANTIALSILIITSIVNLCIQLNTGVIHAFRAAHIVLIVVMSLILHECIASASYLPRLKRYLNFNFEEQRERDVRALFPYLRADNEIPKRMGEYLMGVSMMAQSGCPQFLMARSLRSFSVSILGLVSASTFFVILIASIIHKNKFVGLNTCSGESDYKWSILGVLIAQTIAVAVGLVAPTSRFIYFIRASIVGGLLRRPRKDQALEGGGDDEESLLWHLIDVTNESLIFSNIEDRQKRPVVYLIKYVCHRLPFLFKIFCESAFTTKIISILPQKSGLEKNGFGPHFLHVKGEKTLIKLMKKYCSCDTQRCIDAGKRGTPQNLIQFLREHLSCDSDGVAKFINDEISSPVDDLDDPLKCWSLVVLTLTSVATALPNINPTSKKSLMTSVNEGLVYIKLIEDNVKRNDKYLLFRAAANYVWLGLDRDRECSWLHVNLPELARKSTSPREVLSHFAGQYDEVLKDYCKKRIEGADMPTTSLLAARVMDSVCQTMLQQDSGNIDSSDVLFKDLCISIAGILGAYLADLMKCIHSICGRCSIEKRRETVYLMLKVFGETKEIMEILEEKGRKIRAPSVEIDS